MQEPTILLWDDLEYLRGNRVPANSTITITYGGRTIEVDLSEDNAAILDKLLAPYLQAGRVTRNAEKPLRDRASRRTQRFREMKAVRKWADENGYSYTTPGGGIYYPKALQDAYEEYVGREVSWP